MTKALLPLSLLAALILVALVWRPGFEPASRSNYQPSFPVADHFTNPYWPTTDSPKLVTPQWIGEEGVEAAAVLSIDDMRGLDPYQSYLEPILQRLEEVDGRAPLSIFTNRIDPNEPQLQRWLDRGLSIEVHTLAHPCPLLKDGDFAEAKGTVQNCVDLLVGIPNMKPVAYRMPCCDSMNSVSPRFFADIMGPVTETGNLLTADSSVFQIFTAADPDLPPSLFADGQEKRFERYVPLGKDFVNTIENYPFPYLIGKTHWQFPCTVPSDWEAQYLQGMNANRTVEDLKAALDATVAKQGLFVFVFHPHGWIENTQVAQLVDYADATYGSRLKFLNMREVQERIDANLLSGQPIRRDDGTLSGTRVVDIDGDGYMDVYFSADAGAAAAQARLWEPKTQSWRIEKGVAAPVSGTPLLDLDGDGQSDEPKGEALRFWDLDEDGDLDAVSNAERYAVYLREGSEWIRLKSGRHAEAGGLVPPPFLRADGSSNGVWMGRTTFIIQNEDTSGEPNVIRRIPYAEILAIGEVEVSPNSDNDSDREVDKRAALLGAQPLEPEEALASMRVGDGLEVQLAVHEPLVMDPIDIAWGPDGKLWVVEMTDYPLGLDGRGTPGGRVRFLEDTDRDGRYERSTVFMEPLPYPTGVMAWREGALVLAAPDLIYAEDRDGDGRADHREVLYTGFGEGNQQHRVNGLQWGLDNWIYLANGDSGGNIRSVKTGQEVVLGQYDLRIRPDEGLLERVSGKTQFGRNRNDAGDWFGCNNSNPVWHFVLDQADLARNPRFSPPSPIVHLPEIPGNAPIFPASVTHERFNDFHTANYITSACGAMIYRATLLPDSYQNSAFVAEPVHNLVHRQVLRPDGVTFAGSRAESEQTSEFFASTDSWSRPVALRTAPDGSLWVVDMYRHVIEHPEWIPHDWEEQLDLRAGHDRGRLYRIAPAGHQALPAPDLTSVDDEALAALLQHDSGTVRDLAQQQLLARQRNDAEEILLLENAEELLLPALSSHDWRHRLQALATLDGLQQVSRVALEAALQDDHFAVRRWALRLAGILKGEWEFPREENHPKVLLQKALTLGELEGQGEALAEFALGTENRFIWAACVSSLTKDSEGFLRRLAEAELTEAQAPLLRWVMESLPAEALVRRLGEPTEFAIWRASLVRPALPEQRDAVEPLLLAASNALEVPDTSPVTRAAAIELLYAAEMPFCSLDQLTSYCQSGEALIVQQTAARLIAEHFPDESTNWLLTAWPTLEPRLRQELSQWLGSRPSAALNVLEALEALEARPQPDLLRTLARHLDRRVRTEAASRLEAKTANREDHKVLVDRVLTLSGDRSQGEIHFRVLCAVCHQLQGEGQAVGPDLATLTNPSPEFLLEAILQPNAAVEDKYVAYLAETQNGGATIGLLEGEAGGAVRLRLANGESQDLLRRDLKQLTSTGQSLMPEGLAAELSAQDLADLLAYIRSARPPRKTYQFNEPEVVIQGPDGAIDLPATKASVHGPSLTFERRYLNLGNWKHVQDQAVWDFHCRQAERYQVYADFSCDGGSAGDTLALRIAGESLHFEVPATRNWNAFQESPIGVIDLPAGEHELVARSHGPIRNFLIDLRKISFRPLSE